MKKAISNRLTALQKRDLAALAALPDDKIDLTDMPEIRDWSGFQRGLLYRPVKRQTTLRIDADIIAWFKSRMQKGKGYQTSINRALREYVEEHASSSS